MSFAEREIAAHREVVDTSC